MTTMVSTMLTKMGTKDVRLVRSVDYDEFAQTSEKNEIRKGGKKRKCVA